MAQAPQRCLFKQASFAQPSVPLGLRHRLLLQGQRFQPRQRIPHLHHQRLQTIQTSFNAPLPRRRRSNSLGLPNKLAALTPFTVTDKQILRDQLAEAQQQGWALSWEELEIGLVAIGAPITGRDGEPIAAVSISGPTARLDRSQIKHLAIMVMDTTKRITRDLGFRRR